MFGNLWQKYGYSNFERGSNPGPERRCGQQPVGTRVTDADQLYEYYFGAHILVDVGGDYLRDIQDLQKMSSAVDWPANPPPHHATFVSSQTSEADRGRGQRSCLTSKICVCVVYNSGLVRSYFQWICSLMDSDKNA